MSTKSKAAAAEEKKPITLSSEHVPLSYRIKKDLQRNGMIYAMLIPVLVYYAIFKFGPMFGLYISFIDYKPARGIFGSKFVGLKWFKSFFSDYYFGRLLINTVRIAVADLLTFPLPVILALLINELKNKKFSKTAQTLLYVPHFISTVVICGIVITLTSSTGAVQQCITVSIALTEVLTLIFNRVLQGLQVGFQGCIKRCHFCISLQKSAQLCSRSLHMLRHSHFWMNCSSRPVVHRGRSLILGHPDSNASVTCFPA